MFGCAIAWGHWPETAGNPCHGIARYQRRPRGWLLGADGLEKLGAALRRLEAGSPLRVAAMRLILLTEFWPGEIRRLRRCEIKANRLTLITSKTRPRHVLLDEAARALLNGLAVTAFGQWVFPGENGDEPLTEGALYWYWTKARDHEWRVPVVAGCLLGHRRASTTNRYVHFDDPTSSEADERAGGATDRKSRVSLSSPTGGLPGLVDATPMRRNPGMVG